MAEHATKLVRQAVLKGPHQSWWITLTVRRSSAIHRDRPLRHGCKDAIIGWKGAFVEWIICFDFSRCKQPPGCPDQQEICWRTWRWWTPSNCVLQESKELLFAKMEHRNAILRKWCSQKISTLTGIRYFAARLQGCYYREERRVCIIWFDFSWCKQPSGCPDQLQSCWR